MGCGAGKVEKQQDVKTNWYQDFESQFPSLECKVFCVTGCTSGIGYVCARAAARKGAHVVMLNCQSKQSVAAEKCLAEQVPGAKVTSIPCDLQSFDSVLAAAAALKEKFAATGIDVLFNNPGVMACSEQDTNHVLRFLLAVELLPLLQLATQIRGEARVVTVGRCTNSDAAAYPGRSSGGGKLGSRKPKVSNVVYTHCSHDRVVTTRSKGKSVCAALGFAVPATSPQKAVPKAGMRRYAQPAKKVELYFMLHAKKVELVSVCPRLD